MTARYHHIKANIDNPMLVASNGYAGLDLVLWSISETPDFHMLPHAQRLHGNSCIGYCSYTIAAGLACFWFVIVVPHYSILGKRYAYAVLKGSFSRASCIRLDRWKVLEVGQPLWQGRLGYVDLIRP